MTLLPVVRTHALDGYWRKIVLTVLFMYLTDVRSLWLTDALQWRLLLCPFAGCRSGAGLALVGGRLG